MGRCGGPCSRTSVSNLWINSSGIHAEFFIAGYSTWHISEQVARLKENLAKKNKCSLLRQRVIFAAWQRSRLVIKELNAMLQMIISLWLGGSSKELIPQYVVFNYSQVSHYEDILWSRLSPSSRRCHRITVGIFINENRIII